MCANTNFSSSCITHSWAVSGLFIKAECHFTCLMYIDSTSTTSSKASDLGGEPESDCEVLKTVGWNVADWGDEFVGSNGLLCRISVPIMPKSWELGSSKRATTDSMYSSTW
ncbi:hypothetical protein PC116_g34658 [Phytophthora cactorum]|nr:hypothetical protein PC116_g34658 [Phytophthora cactorum]